MNCLQVIFITRVIDNVIRTGHKPGREVNLPMDSLVYEDIPLYDKWFRAILGLILIAVLVPALVMINSDPETSIGLFGTAVFVVILLWVILPRKYLVLNDRLKIILGMGLSISVALDNIEAARIPKGLTAGINFITSIRNPVEIVRRKGLNINISPGNRDLFLENMDRALNDWRDRRIER